MDRHRNAEVINQLRTELGRTVNTYWLSMNNGNSQSRQAAELIFLTVTGCPKGPSPSGVAGPVTGWLFRDLRD